MRNSKWLRSVVGLAVLMGTLAVPAQQPVLAFGGGDACWDGFLSNEAAADAAGLGWIERAYWYMGNIGQYYACKNLEMSTNQ